MLRECAFISIARPLHYGFVSERSSARNSPVELVLFKTSVFRITRYTTPISLSGQQLLCFIPLLHSLMSTLRSFLFHGNDQFFLFFGAHSEITSSSAMPSSFARDIRVDLKAL